MNSGKNKALHEYPDFSSIYNLSLILSVHTYICIQGVPNARLHTIRGDRTHCNTHFTYKKLVLQSSYSAKNTGYIAPS